MMRNLFFHRWKLHIITKNKSKILISFRYPHKLIIIKLIKTIRFE